MLYDERKNEILKQFNGKTTIKISDIADEFHVSVDTVRRDLKAMERENLVKYVHGGAVLTETCRENIQYANFNGRKISNKDLKLEAVRKAVNEIKEGDVIFINSGTTNVLLAEEIANKCNSISVITNNLAVAEVFINAEKLSSIDITVVGGLLDISERSLYGYQCEKELATYYPDLCFLSINAVNEKQGYTDFRLLEMGIMKIIQKNSKRMIAVMDSTKLGKRSQKQLFTSDKVDILYMDNNISEEIVQRYADKGIVIM